MCVNVCYFEVCYFEVCDLKCVKVCDFGEFWECDSMCVNVCYFEVCDSNGVIRCVSKCVISKSVIRSV